MRDRLFWPTLAVCMASVLAVDAWVVSPWWRFVAGMALIVPLALTWHWLPGDA